MKTATKTKYKAGDRVCTVGRDGSRLASTGSGFSVSIYIGKIYEAKERQSDGGLTWRLVGEYGGTRAGDRPSKSFVSELEADAEHDFILGITHGKKVK